MHQWDSWAQRKIPVALSFPYHRHKAGIANGQQTVQWTFAVSGALWRSSRSWLWAAGWRICQLRWKMHKLYSRPVTWFDVSMSRKCHNNGKLPVFEYLRSMNPSYCVTEVRMLKNANLLFPLIRVTLKSSIRKTPYFPGRQGHFYEK